MVLSVFDIFVCSNYLVNFKFLLIISYLIMVGTQNFYVLFWGLIWFLASLKAATTTTIVSPYWKKGKVLLE